MIKRMIMIIIIKLIQFNSTMIIIIILLITPTIIPGWASTRFTSMWNPRKIVLL